MKTEGLFHQVSPHVYARISRRTGGSNGGFVLCREGVVVVDSAPSPAESRADLEALRRISRRPLHALILTHHHSDHWFGAQAFECEVIASVSTAREMVCLGNQYARDTREHHRHLGPDLEGLRLTYPTRTFEERMRLGAAPGVEAIRTGGHTTGTTVIYVPDDRVIFASDLVFHGIHPYTKGADLPRWVTALESILKMNVETVIPGHGAICTKAAVSEQKRYLTLLQERLARLKRRGWSLDQVLADLGILGLPDLHRVRRLGASVRAHWDGPGPRGVP